jgi:lysophospholipase L1-like esterase
MRIIIFTDSLGRPRPDLDISEKTDYEDVYGYKLREYFKNSHEIELVYVESLDTEDAKFWGERMVAFRKPDLVIFQIGINDCAPRIFSKNTLLQCILNNKVFKKYTKNIIPRVVARFRYPITKYFKKVYTKPEDFKSNYQHIMSHIKEYNKNCNFLCLSILESNELNIKSHNFNANVKYYNQLLSYIFLDNYIELNGALTQSSLISDGIHMTRVAHEEVFNILKKEIEKLCVE